MECARSEASTASRIQRSGGLCCSRPHPKRSRVAPVRPQGSAARGAGDSMRLNENVIVLADDDAEMCKSFAMMFEAKGYAVHACGDGLRALSLCKEKRPAVVLLDLDMPKLDGYEVARRLRADPDLAGLRIVAVTGRSDEKASALAWEAGFHDFLSKPAPVSMLLAMIRSTREIQAIRDE